MLDDASEDGAALRLAERPTTPARYMRHSSLTSLPHVSTLTPTLNRCVMAGGAIDTLPGALSDRRSPLGELNWIFTAVTAQWSNFQSFT